MLTHLRVQNFQALHDVSLDLSPLTVIVGASSSGKSALTRALHTLTHNRRGTEWITHGEQQATIEATTEQYRVTLTRTTKPGDGNAYQVVSLAPPSTSSPTEPERFTKLGSAVPAEVSRALGIYPDGINFAGQHDMPFMLATTGSSNASALGRLTNVHTIFEAAREANRQRAQSTSTLKTRQGDIESIRAGLARFKNLAAQRAAIERAEEASKRAHMTSSRLERLRYLTSALQVTSGAIPALQQAAARTIPSTQAAEQSSASLTRLHALRGALIAHVKEAQQAAEAVKGAAVTVDALTDARAGLTAELTQDIDRAMRPDAHEDGTITVEHAAATAAEYIRDVL